MMTHAPEALSTHELTNNQLERVNGGIDWQRWAMMPSAVYNIGKLLFQVGTGQMPAPRD
jgi:hypothetical protein